MQCKQSHAFVSKGVWPMAWFSYLRIKTDILSAQYIKSSSYSDTSRHLQFGKVTCSVTVSRQWTTPFSPTHPNPSPSLLRTAKHGRNILI